MNKLEILKYELNLIKDKNIKHFNESALKLLPDYFWTISASSTAKYHPKYALGEGGLVKHTQCAVRIAESLFQIVNFSNEEQDIIISALLLHDGCKKGLTESQYVKHDHPEIIIEFLLMNKLDEFISIKQFELLSNCIRKHMGKWNTNNYDKTVLLVPQTKIERFVHMCDYLASRKFLNLDLE